MFTIFSVVTTWWSRDWRLVGEQRSVNNTNLATGVCLANIVLDDELIVDKSPKVQPVLPGTRWPIVFGDARGGDASIS